MPMGITSEAACVNIKPVMRRAVFQAGKKPKITTTEKKKSMIIDARIPGTPYVIIEELFP